MDTNGGADYFCDGLTDEIITDLSSVRSLRTICRTSAMRLKGTRDTPQKIARDLNVRYVLEGAVRVNNNAQTGSSSIRVTVQLIDPQSQSLLWAEKYSGTLDDVFAIQENISRQIVSALKIQLTPAEDEHLLDRPLPDINAYRYYLMAKHEILNYSSDALARALEYLRMGEALVGKNVLLLSAKGQVYWQYVNAGISSDPQYLVKAKDCADEALRLDPKLRPRLPPARSHQRAGGRDPESRSDSSSAPSSPTPTTPTRWPGTPPSAASAARRTQPCPSHGASSRSIPSHPSIASSPDSSHSWRGNFPDALPSFDDAIKMDPTNAMLLWCRGQVLALCGRTQDAITQLRELAKLHPDHFFTKLGDLMQAALVGDSEAATSIATEELLQIAGCDPHYSWSVAESYSLLGDTAKALAWIEKAMAKGFINFPMINQWDPLLQNARKDPQFSDLAERLHILWTEFEI